MKWTIDVRTIAYLIGKKTANAGTSRVFIPKPEKSVRTDEKNETIAIRKYSINYLLFFLKDFEKIWMLQVKLRLDVLL